MLCIKRAFSPAHIDGIELHGLADLHTGDPLADIKLFKERVERIARTSNAFVILNGDICDNAISDSVGDTYSATKSPIGQVQSIAEILKPIKDRILCINSGNHEWRSAKKVGIDLAYALALELGLTNLYSENSTLLFLRTGRSTKGPNRQHCYSIYIQHGSKSGSTVGSKANALAKLENIVNADVYIHSHTHLPLLFKQGRLEVNKNNNSATFKETLFVNTGAFMDYGGYANREGYRPSSKSSPVIYIPSDGSCPTAKL